MIHPVLTAAADGELPTWAEVTPGRRQHMERVADLMGAWSTAFGLGPDDTLRWRAAGMLHDALRDADPASLAGFVAAEAKDLPASLHHGPAAAWRLRADGVRDEPLLLAIQWHSTGHPDLDALGRALYLADYLEPGRRHEPAVAAARRSEVPAAMHVSLQATVAERIGHALDARHPILDPTVRFWNRLVHA